MKKYLLPLIILLGFLIRFWHVGTLPVILNRDEAALAYNAVLLKETGQDEWQQKRPFALKSFGDYKLPGYPVALLPVFSVFGYIDFAVRFPSVIAGTLLIVVVYFFVAELFPKEKDEILAAFAATVVAVLPVFFFYSRMAWEANVGLCLFVGALYFLFKKDYSRKMDLRAIFFLLLAIFTYNTPLLLLPFILPVFIWWRGIKEYKKLVFPISGVVLVLIMGFASLLSLSKQKSGITIFSDESYWKKSVDYRLQFSGFAQKVLGNRYVYFGGVMAGNYFKTFLPEFLVTHGGAHPWHGIPGFGHLYWVVYLLGLLGISRSIVEVWKHKVKTDKKYLFLLYLLVISPLPAVVTVDAPHATRSLLFFFVFVIFAVIGLQTLLEKFAKNKVMIWSIVGVLLLSESSFYMYNYFTKYPGQSQEILHGGYAQVIQEANAFPAEKKIAVVDPDGYQYVSTAWYLKMKPEEFFHSIERHLPDRIGFRYGYKVGRFRFIAAEADRFPDESALVVWSAEKKIWEIKKFE